MIADVKNILDHKAGVSRPLQGGWSEKEAHELAQGKYGLMPGEYTLSGDSPVNESQYWPD